MEQEELELKILKHFVQNEKAREKLVRKQTGLKLEYFSKGATRKIVEWILLYTKKYESVPENYDTIREFSKNEILKLEEPLKGWCINIIKQIFIPPLPEENFEFCIDTLQNNWKSRYGAGVINTALTDLSNKDFDNFCLKINKMSRKIKIAGLNLPSLNTIGDYERILSEHKYRAQHKELFKKIPTGLKWFDRTLNGGLSLGEYYLLMGYTGRGKSFIGTQCAYFAAFKGFNVAIANLEMTNKKAMNRLYSRITAISYERFYDPWKMTENNYEDWHRAMSDWKSDCGQIEILPFEKPPTVDDISAKLSELNKQTDLLIIDQITNMSGKLEWQELESIAKEIEFLAKSWDNERGLAVITFGQVKANTIYNKYLNVGDFAYGKGVCEHATAVAYLSQTKEDIEENLIRLGICKNRDGENVTTQQILYPNRDISRIHCTEREARENEDENEDTPF